MHDHQHQPSHASGSDFRAQRLAMRLSLWIGLGMFAAKVFAYVWTGSAAILSDAAESVVHVAAVAFATYSLWLSQQPPDRNHLYGHEKIGFFSAGFEGGMIVLAALFIIYESIRKLIVGSRIDHLGDGTVLVAIAAGVNAVLGWYLVRTGRRQRSLILVANGKHVLTDTWTSLGVICALGLVWVTGQELFDPIVAIVIALNILHSGGKLVRESFAGLMDEADPDTDRALRQLLDDWAGRSGCQYHGLRHRSASSIIWVEVHLLFPGHQSLETAHAAATELEDRIEKELAGAQVMVTTHLEPLEQHLQHHPEGGPQHQLIG